MDSTGTDHTVKVFSPDGGKTTSTPQTEGMHRIELVSNESTWVGRVETDPHFTSGWHHHGDYDTYVYVISGKIKMEFGKDGKESVVANKGDVLHVPKNTVHRESNPGDEQQLLFGVRVGSGAPVFNVDEPEK